MEGGIYLKNKHGIENYKFLVFLKIGEKALGRNFKFGLNALLGKAKKDLLEVKSLAFCLSGSELSVAELLRGVAKSSELRSADSLFIHFLVEGSEDFSLHRR